MPSETFSRRRFLRACLITGTAAAAGTVLSPLLPGWSLAQEGALFPADAGAAQKPVSGGELYQETQLLMGTFVTISLICASRQQADTALALAWEGIRDRIAIFDRHNADSALGLLNSQGTLAAAPAELIAVLDQAKLVGQLTNDAFNPAIAPVVDLYRPCKDGAPLPGKQAVAEALALAAPGGVRQSGTKLRLTRTGMRLTLDGIAKGHIADKVSEILLQNGVANHLVNAGGDIRVSGLAEKGRPWTIGVENSLLTGGLEEIKIRSGGIATSGGSQNFYDRNRKHHHLISHRTGKSPDIISVTVKAPTTAEADALATALSLLPPSQAVRLVQARLHTECLIISPQGRHSSKGWA